MYPHTHRYIFYPIFSYHTTMTMYYRTDKIILYYNTYLLHLNDQRRHQRTTTDELTKKKFHLKTMTDTERQIQILKRQNTKDRSNIQICDNMPYNDRQTYRQTLETKIKSTTDKTPTDQQDDNQMTHRKILNGV